ncbi:MAG: hypothetical protein C4523_10915 [Myxococcales bacterium]|nr:MAG: hypothetical protein C4523_10915 [Myxococcales bacterium]
MMVEWRLPAPGKATKVLFTAVFILCILSVIGQVAKYAFGHGRLYGFVYMFYLDNEANISTWYSGFALMIAAALMAVLAKTKWLEGDRYRWHWAGLAVILFCLSIDEVGMIHDHMVEPIRESLHTQGLLYYGWVIAGLASVALVGLIYLRFLFHLPSRLRKLFFLAAFVYVGGAIGVEMLSGLYASRFGEENFLYSIIVTGEEMCEMAGVVILIHALLERLHQTVSGVLVRTDHGGG